MSQDELTSKVAMLSQEPPLLPISIAANIAYGLKPGTASDAAEPAVRMGRTTHNTTHIYTPYVGCYAV